MRRLSPYLVTMSLPLLACGPAERVPAGEGGVELCQVRRVGILLPARVHETSGLALSRRQPGVLWTINDSGNEPVLYAIDSAGVLLGQVRVTGAGLVDWEDLGAGPCQAGTCLFIADIGDNSGIRDSVTIYVVPEPLPSDVETAPAIAFHARYPDGPRDAEALFVLPSGDLFIVSKGRRSPITLYRLPRTAQVPGGTATLERLRDLWPQSSPGSGLVTGATNSPDGRWVMIRTYRNLFRYPSDELTGIGTGSPVGFDLRPLQEHQGEAVALSDTGEVWLTSEADGQWDAPRLSRLSCSLRPFRAGSGY